MSKKNIFKCWILNLYSVIAELFPQSGVNRKVGRYHIWLLTALLVLLTFIYYLDQTPIVEIWPFSSSIFTGVHDLQRTLFLVPLLYAAIVFRVRGSLITSFIFLCVVLPRSFLYSPYPDPLIRVIVFVVIATFVSLLVSVEINRIDSEHAKLQQFLAETISRQEREKQHLARELHDESLQYLVDISHNIDELVDEEVKEDTKTKLKNLHQRINTVLFGIRQFIMGIRPPLLEEMGLGPSLKWLAHDIAEEKGVKVNVQIKGEARRLNDVVELNLFRIAQEALQNAKKHSRATQIDIQLTFETNKIQLNIRDNGIGFTVPSRTKLVAQAKFGLIGMSERARLVGGSLKIDSSWEFGTIVNAELKIKET